MLPKRLLFCRSENHWLLVAIPLSVYAAFCLSTANLSAGMGIVADVFVIVVFLASLLFCAILCFSLNF